MCIQNLSEYKIRKKGKKKRNVNKLQVRIIRALYVKIREKTTHTFVVINNDTIKGV